MARRHSSSPADPTERIIGSSPVIQALRTQIRQLGAFDAIGNRHVPTVLIHGETGTGKGLVARVIHDSGPRASGPFIDVNCAAIPETLLEAELFGFEPGAFTDARRAKPGLFEAASGGTLFLDEVEALPLPLQGKFLIVVEEKRVRRLGAVADRFVDVKLVVATQAELLDHVNAGRFRADLYHRLAVVLIDLPPLRARGEDIIQLAENFLRYYAEVYGLIPKQLSRAAKAWLLGYQWPGNVRELGYLMERAVLLSSAPTLDSAMLEQLCLPTLAVPVSPLPLNAERPPMDETMQITQALIRTGGNVVRAARLLKLSRSALRHRMRQYGIRRPSEEELTRLAPSTVEYVPCPTRPLPLGKGQAESSAKSPADENGVSRNEQAEGQALGWEQKPVAVIAIALTFPKLLTLGAVRYEPWTVAARWEQTIAEKLQGFGGLLLPRTPSLLTVAFGIPQALEQMPQRAVHAALTIRQLVASGRGIGEPCPEVRLAVHHGAVLVNVDVGDPMTRLLPVGDTIAVPIRLLGHASPGEILLSSQVAWLVEGIFQLKARVLPQGTEQPHGPRAYAVIGPWLRCHPLEGVGGRAQSQFVGREQEIRILHDLLLQVERGRGQVVGIVGEPGIGKSRLLLEFRRSFAGRRVMYLEGRCLSYGNAVPYLPLIDLIWHYCRITDADTSMVITQKVHDAVQKAGMDPKAWAPYLLQPLGVRAGMEQLDGLNPEALKERTFEVLRQLSLKTSQRQPLIVAVEDVHWIDKSSEDFLTSLVESMAGAAICLIVTYRPGYRPPWSAKSYVTQLALQPLAPDDSLTVLRSMLQEETLSDPVAHTIVQRAEGNPLFLEELARTVIESGEFHSDSELPDTIQGVLMARIDRLPPASKRLLQVASVLGREFSSRLLEAIWKASESLASHLLELSRSEFLYERTEANEPIYAFKHSLIQEAAYESLSPSQRRALHRAAARALEALYAERLEQVYERLAYHYERTDEVAKAIQYWTCVAEKAVQGYAHTEALAALQQACVHVERLPPEERDRCYLTLCFRLAQCLFFLHRFQDLLHFLLQQQERLERCPEPRLAGPYYFWLGLAYANLGDQEQAAQYVRRALDEARQCNEEVTIRMLNQPWNP